MAAAHGAPIPAFHAGTLAQVDAAVRAVRLGVTRSLGTTQRGFPLWLVEYGPRQVTAGGATWSSALGCQRPECYAARDQRTVPVVYLIGMVHGHETEGISGVVNLIHLLEQGTDLRGRVWPELLDKARRCRLLLVPAGNPDGRDRVPYDGFVGVPMEQQMRYGLGERADGTPYGWPECKWQMPVVNDIRYLGGYYTDGGVNIMHDDFFSPQALETRVLLDVARIEAPDLVCSLHSHPDPPFVLQQSFVPLYQKRLIKQLGDRVAARFRAAQLPAGTTPEAKPDGETAPGPSFNFVSALHHVCGGLACAFESPHGYSDEAACQVDYEQLLDLQLLLYDELLGFALELQTARVR